MRLAARRTSLHSDKINFGSTLGAAGLLGMVKGRWRVMLDPGVNLSGELPQSRRFGLSVVRQGFHWSEDSFLALLVFAHATAIILASILAKIFYIDLFLGQEQSLQQYVWPAMPLLIALCYVYRQMRLLSVNTLLEPVIGFGKVWGGLIIAFFMMLGLLYMIKVVDFYSRGWLISWFGLSSLLLVWVRWSAMKLCRSLTASGLLRERVAVYGEPKQVQGIVRQITSSGNRQHLGIYQAGADGRPTEVGFDGDLLALQAAMERGDFDKIIIGFAPNDSSGINAAVSALSSFSVELLLCTDHEILPYELLDWRSLAGLRVGVLSRAPAVESNRLFKKLFDNTVASAGLVFVAPVLVVAAIAIKIDSPGPVFFRQRRYGQNNRVFRIYKFRTMTVAEDGEIVRQARQNDPRVTRVGAILRATSIDELPQLLNVLAGDMSIVGPRPHALVHDEAFAREVELFTSRRRVLPGLTGWAQVNGYRGETKSLEDIRGRMQHDQYYIRNWSIWFDIEIMVRTIGTLFRGAH